MFEGRSGRILGRVINEFMNSFDPRGVTYSHFIPEGLDSPKDVMRFLADGPGKGIIGIYDRSWYSMMVSRSCKGPVSEDRISGCLEFERYLCNNGVILLKFFMNMSDESLADMNKVMGTYTGNRTFLTDDHLDPKRWSEKVAMPLIASTSTNHAPWDIIDVKGWEDTLAKVFHTFISRVTHALEFGIPKVPSYIESRYPNPRDDVDLGLKAKGYKTELKELSIRVARLQSELAQSNRSLVLVFEGWDAAGKGGSIKRLVRALNPRGYVIRPVAAPVGDECNHTYLWRFASDLPAKGHITIFDRSWYGRMMVEPIEGFCTEEEYQRSAEEIRNFEQFIADSGGIIIKFWMEVSPEEQLARFKARQENPFKQWKITDEDWRNREKWDVYEEHIDRMMESTNAPFAPWVAVESEDKKYARLKVLRTVIDTLEDELIR